MSHARHENWIGGAFRPALAQETFEVTADGSRECLARYSRSSERDLALAVEAARSAERDWVRRGPAARRACLAQALERLASRVDPGGLSALRLGLDADELSSGHAPLVRGVERILARGDVALARGVLGARDGPFLLAPDWSELWAEPARLLVFGLLAGRPAIVVSDGRAPMIAEALALACAELPPGVVSLLHDDTLTCLRAARDVPGLESLHVSELRDESGEMTALKSSRAASVWRASNVTFVVSADVESDAARVAHGAFSKGQALSGARVGQIGRVVCPARCFSRFTEALLAALERDSALERPIELVKRTLASHVERAFAMGHDEGATAIFTGARSAAHGFPLVFTNVEPRMRLARRRRPLPVLCLLRVPDASRGRELAREFDEPSDLENASRAP